MSGHLSLKWNNHSSAFLQSINQIQAKAKFSDATIVCQGKCFSVHRMILSTCSEYFEQLFEQINSQQPYIVFKDIDATEMELLLNYMYQGEVNVIQEMLPSLIKAAEVLKIKGLAVPDDDMTTKKRMRNDKHNLKNKRHAKERNRENETERINEENMSEITSDFEIPFPIKKEVDIEAYTDYGSTDFHSGKQESSQDYSSNFDVCDINIKTESTISQEIPLPDLTHAWPLDSTINTLGGTDTRPVESTSFNPEFCTNQESGSMPNNIPVDWSGGQETFQKRNTTLPRHECPFCAYCSIRRNDIQRHIRFKHTREKPYKCSVCDARFVEKVAVRRHFMNKHFSKR